MCGVCGIVTRSGSAEAAGTAARVAAMVDALAHRGPDDAGTVRSGGAVLGATRLAIRGLASGKQPLLDEASGIVVVCNGEIDNHRDLRGWLSARGRSVPMATDVAVIPGLYLELGEEFVGRLAGAFAVGLWDPRERRLVLARDRAGERPLFFHVSEERIRFATEIRALAAEPGLALTLDEGALAGYLRFGSFAAPGTPFREIRKVGPAEIVTFGPEGISRRRYWRWSVGRSAGRASAPAEDAFDGVFREAVRRQADVEVACGVFLSGGIDSSLVAAVARSVAPERKLRAYTLRFDESSYDEGDFAGRVAARLEIESVPVWIKPEEIPGGIAELVRIVGEPLADPAWVPTALLARRASAEVKCALVGEGADELFGGYPTYLGARLADRYAGLPRGVRAALRKAIDLLPPSEKKVTLSFLLKRFVAGAELAGVARHLLWTSNIPPPLLERLGVPAPPIGAREGAGGDVLDIVQRIDLETSLAEGLLTKADRAGMQSALELRAPFLDAAVMDFAASLPPEERVRGLTTKVFLKRYALRYLPRGIVHRRKRGLSVPLSRWLRGPLHEWARSRLRSGRLDRSGVDPEAALALLEEHRLRRADHARALWTLIVLAEWLLWSEGLGAPGAGER